MLIPRFSLRTTLILISGCAIFFLILGQAVQGSGWAIVVSMTVASLVATLLLHATLFVLSSALARLVGAEHLPARTSRGGVQLTSDQQAPPPTDDA
jgi:hypothetical protein